MEGSSSSSAIFYDFLDRMRNPASLDLVRSIKRYFRAQTLIHTHTYLYCLVSFIDCIPFLFSSLALLSHFRFTRPTLKMTAKRFKNSTQQWKMLLGIIHCGQVPLIRRLIVQWRYSLPALICQLLDACLKHCGWI